MKKLLYITSLLLWAGVAFGLPKHVVIAVPKAAWEGGDETNIKAFFKNMSITAKDITFVTWRQKNNHAKEWYISCYWTKHLKRKLSDKISQAKIDALKAKLVEAKIRLKLTDTPKADLDEAGLEPIPREEP